MSRTEIPNRRQGVNLQIEHRAHKFVVGFNRVGNGPIEEAFYRSSETARPSSEMAALIRDSCILFSLLRQHGPTAAEIAESLGEDRAEGATSGAPSGLIGAIARAAAPIDAENSANVQA